MSKIRRLAAYGILLTAVGTLGACSLKPPRQGARVYIDLSELKRDMDRSASAGEGDTVGILTAPSTLSGFNCLLVNVVGPGIPDTSVDPETNLPPIIDGLIKGNFCTYLGVFGGPILKSSGTFVATPITVQVPSGPTRIIQAIGVVDPRVGTPMCDPAQFASQLQGGNDDGVEYYEVGRAIVNLFSDQSVVLANRWDSATTPEKTARRVNCGNHGDSTPPAITFSTSFGVPSASLTQGNAYAINYSVSDNAGTVTGPRVKLDYSTDSGSTWTSITTSATAESGTYSWTVPAITCSSTCKVRAQVADMSGNLSTYAVSATAFSVGP